MTTFPQKVKALPHGLGVVEHESRTQPRDGLHLQLLCDRGVEGSLPGSPRARVQGQKADWLADAEAREVEQAKTAKPAAPVVKKARPRFRQRFVKR